MATPADTTTDKGIGFAILLGVIATVGAVGMAVTAPETGAGWAFAVAMLFASLAVVGIHLYWD